MQKNLLSYTQNKIEIIMKMQVLRSWYAHCGPSVTRTAGPGTHTVVPR